MIAADGPAKRLNGAKERVGCKIIITTTSDRAKARRNPGKAKEESLEWSSSRSENYGSWCCRPSLLLLPLLLLPATYVRIVVFWAAGESLNKRKFNQFYMHIDSPYSRFFCTVRIHNCSYQGIVHQTLRICYWLTLNCSHWQFRTAHNYRFCCSSTSAFLPLVPSLSTRKSQHHHCSRWISWMEFCAVVPWTGWLKSHLRNGPWSLSLKLELQKDSRDYWPKANDSLLLNKFGNFTAI